MTEDSKNNPHEEPPWIQGANLGPAPPVNKGSVTPMHKVVLEDPAVIALLKCREALAGLNDWQTDRVLRWLQHEQREHEEQEA